MVTQNRNVTLKAADKSLGRQKASTFANTIRMNPQEFFFFLLIFKLFGVLQSVVNVTTHQKKPTNQRQIPAALSTTGILWHGSKGCSKAENVPT